MAIEMGSMRNQAVNIGGASVKRTVRKVERYSVSRKERDGKFEYCTRDAGFALVNGWSYMVERVSFFDEQVWGEWFPVMDDDGSPLRFERRIAAKRLDAESVAWLERVVLGVCKGYPCVFTASHIYADAFNNHGKWSIVDMAGEAPERAVMVANPWFDYNRGFWVKQIYQVLTRLAKRGDLIGYQWTVIGRRDVKAFIDLQG